MSLVKQFESLTLNAKKIEATGILTIGYGHVGPDVYEGQHITKEKAEELFAEDLSKYAHCVNTYVRGVPLTSN